MAVVPEPGIFLTDLLLLFACLLPMLNISKTRSRRKTPKEKPDRRKARKRLPIKGPFRVKENSFKVYRQPTQAMIDAAYAQRAQRLANPSKAEKRFNEILKSIGYVEDRDYERESIRWYPCNHARFDFFFKQRAIVFEIDDITHEREDRKRHDAGRDLYFARQGIRTVRIKDRVVLRKDESECRAIILREIQGRG